MNVSTPQAQPTDRSVVLLVAAAVLAVTVVVAVVAFGLQRPPSLPSLSDEPAPAPSGPVAWTTWRDDTTCVDVAEPGGRTREVWCDPTGADLVGWTDDGHLAVSDWSGQQAQILVVELDTGDVVRSEPDPDGRAGEAVWSRGQEVVGHRDGGDLVVERTPGTEVWRVASPDTYGVRAGSVSPDGRWVAVVDSADRLLLLATDGSAPPRMWASGVETHVPPAWRDG